MLHEWHWPLDAPRGAVALVHGAGEYCGRYDHVARWLNDAGYALLGLDLPGFGRSSGTRGHIDRFDDYLPAVDSMLARLETVYPGSPRFLYGHSMGGLVVVRWFQQRPAAADSRLAGVVLTSPCLDLSLDIPPALLRAGAVLEQIWPTLSQSSRIPATAVSRHPDVVRAYRSDPLVLHRVTVRWAMELQRAMRAARLANAALPAPTLVLQAGEDKLVSPAATRAFASRLDAPEKEYREFPGCYHELHNEPERQEVLVTITSFLDHAVGLWQADRG